MAGSFPTLSGGTTVMYPLRIKVSCLTRIQRGTNAAEQRYAVAAPFATFDATYTNLSAADQASVQGFHDSQKGAFDSTWDLTFDGKTFTAMRFTSDELKWTETIPNRWTTQLGFAGFYPAISSPPSTFPALPSGAVTQLPWSKRRTYETSFTDLEVGVRHATAARDGGLTNFPTAPELRWDITLRAIRPADAENHIKFFISQHGRFGSFSFTDPDTLVTSSGCRYDSDDLTVSYDGYNRCSISLTIIKT
jgi:hypothetical protein